METTNQTSRKLIHAITNNGTLNNFQPTAIQQAATATGLQIDVQNNQIIMPEAHADIKALLQFLNENRFNGPLTGSPFVTNSKRTA